MEIETSIIVATIINFILLLIIMKYFLFKPVDNIITARQQRISEDIEKANSDKVYAENLKNENEKKLIEIEDKGKKIIEDYKLEAEKIQSGIIRQANKEADQMLDRTREEIERQKEEAAIEIENQIIDLAVELSSKALEKSIDVKTHRQLIEDFIVKLGV